MLIWFMDDHTGRPLADREQAFLNALPLPTKLEETSFDGATVLSVVSPPQADEWFRAQR